MWGRPCARKSPDRGGENQFSALERDTESEEKDDSADSDVESVSAAVATRFILDSGSTYDIMNKRSMPKFQPAVPLPRTEPVATANGTSYVKDGVQIQLAGRNFGAAGCDDG